MAHDDDAQRAREEMVARQLEARGITDPAVLHAMLEVPREFFVPEGLRNRAYLDAALPIQEGQTISQPYIVALMAMALQLTPDDKVLEIGTGSGYAAAVLSRIAREVYTIERHEGLARAARERLDALGYRNIYVAHGDGTLGWPEYAPFNVITVAASGPQVPDALRSQLKIGGRLVMPTGSSRIEQKLVRVVRESEDAYRQENLVSVSFVPLIGREGWEDEGSEA